MAKGKFSSPRPYREEEREIEQAYHQVKEKKPSPWQRRKLEETAELPRIPESMLPPTGEAHQPTEAEIPPAPPTEAPVPAPGQAGRFLPPEEPIAEEEYWEEDEPGFLDRALDFFERNKKVALAGACAAALLLIVGVISVFFASTADPYDNQILDNVYVAGVNVGGMKKKEAVSAVKKAADARYAQEPMVIDLAGTELTLASGQVSPRLDVNAAINAAYDYGRKGTNAEKEAAYQNSLTGSYVISLGRFLDLNETYIRQTLTSTAESSGSTLTQTKYGLEGTQPELSAEAFSAQAPCQTLVILMGRPGAGFDPDAVFDQVMDAYDRYEFRVTVEDIQSTKDPDPIDLDSIYKEYYIAPVEASVDPETYEPIPGSYGYGFDLEAARELVSQAEFGQELRIPMEYIAPENLEGSVLFQDTLGQHQTTHTSGKNRNVNLQLACEAIDGLILDPGMTFSFKEAVGKPTSEKGYKYAFTDSDEYYDETLGGGINQVASTLYYSVLLSDLAIVSRECQTYPASYIDYGLDAEVEYGSADLQFKNTTAHPIRIEAEVSGGYVKVQILGTDQRSYYVKLESRIQNTYMPGTEYREIDPENEEGYQDGDVIRKGISGFHVKTYKLTYDKSTNELLSRVEETSSRYQPVDEIVAKYKEEPTEATEETLPEITETEMTEPPATETEVTDPPETEPAPTQPEESEPIETDGEFESDAPPPEEDSGDGSFSQELLPETGGE